MSGNPVSSRRLPWRWWLAVLVFWTLLLVTPANWFPGGVTKPLPGGIGPGKLLHVSAYAFLAATAGWLPGARAARLQVVIALIAHGGLTEALQHLAPGREGCWRDVGIDAAGVILGGLASWRLWPKDDAPAR